MAAEVQYTIGAEVICTDGPCGQVTRVVVGPVARVVTGLVVEPAERHGLGRLVPLDLPDAGPNEVRLRCTTAEFERLGSAGETEFLPGTSGAVKVVDEDGLSLSVTKQSAGETEFLPGTSGAVKVADEDGLSLSVTKQEAGDLPPVDIDRPGR